MQTRKTLYIVTAFIGEKGHKNNHQRVPDTTIGSGETSVNDDTDDYYPILNTQEQDVKQTYMELTLPMYFIREKDTTNLLQRTQLCKFNRNGIFAAV